MDFFDNYLTIGAFIDLTGQLAVHVDQLLADHGFSVQGAILGQGRQELLGHVRLAVAKFRLNHITLRFDSFCLLAQL